MQERIELMIRTARLRAKCVYGIGFEHFASVEASEVDVAELPWTCPEDWSQFPWLDLDHFGIGLERNGEDADPAYEEIDVPEVACICDGIIINAQRLFGQNGASRYANVSGLDSDPEEFDIDVEVLGSNEFDAKRLTIHYKTAARPGASDLRLVTFVEYDGRQIYSAGRIVENCEMPSAGDLGDLLYDYTVCDGWYKRDGADWHAWKLLARENARGTVVVPAFVDEIAEDAFADCGGLERLYIKEKAYCCIGEHVRLNCAKVPQSIPESVLDDEEDWRVIKNGFFSGYEVHQSEYLFKESHCGRVRWLELRPREFQYICSLAFGLPREECDEVRGRWLFTRNIESGNLLLRLASAFMEGSEVEQDLPMALRCCEHACWCAVGDEIPVAPGDVFPGVEVVRVDQLSAVRSVEGILVNDDVLALQELYERANRQRETVLTRFQRIEIGMFEIRDSPEETLYIVPDLAFEGREDLRDVLLPDELFDQHVVVGHCSFAGCTSLRSITVAGMAEEFRIARGETSFLGCDHLSDRIQYSMSGSTLTLCLNAPKEFTVCSHVKMIAPSAFQWSQRLRYFVWDMYEGEEGEEAFVYCPSIRIVGHSAFEGCRNLLHVCVKGCEIAIGAMAFRDCRLLNEFKFGARSSRLDMPLLNVSFEEAFAECVSLHRITTIGERGCLMVEEYRDVSLDYMDRNNYLSGWGADSQARVGRWQFRSCRVLREIPPIVAMYIPAGMFEDCEWLEHVRCIVAKALVISLLQTKLRPSHLELDDVFRIAASAFAHCRNLEWFKFYRMRAAIIGTDEKSAAIRVVELMEEPPMRVEFEQDAFLDCWRLSRVESSFASAAHSSHPSAFSGCPEFDGFVEN